MGLVEALMAPAAALMAVAAAGSVVAATRHAQPSVLRLAHAVMGMVMLAMVAPGGRPASLAAMVALGVMVPVVLGHYVRHGAGLPCVTDLLGMAVVVGVSLAARPQPRIIVLVAAGWLVSSLWAHGEAALSTRLTRPIALEGGTAVIGAVAMGLMTLAMT